MTTQEIHAHLTSLFTEFEFTLDDAVPCITLPAAALRDVALQLRDDADLCFDNLMCLSGVDYNDGTLGVVYHLESMRLRHKLTLKVIVPADHAVVPTVERVWRTADWHEREAWDLLGIVFDGHQDPRRILLPDDWEGHPLRKNYQVPEFYNGMKVPY
jgi:NADH-quinone oxidoreductase subunit C